MVYDHAFRNLDISTLINEQVISNNKRSTNKFKEKYPFYNDLLLLVITESDMAIRKTKIVQFIISYLDIINENGNIQVKKGSLTSISKRSYSVEKNKILKDLNFILKEVFLFQEINVSTKPLESCNISPKIKEIKIKFDSSKIIDSKRWELIIKDLSSDNIINDENIWVGLGANLSKPATQLAVFVYLLEDSGIFKMLNQNKQIPEISEFFKVKLSSARYSQVKKGFSDGEGISKHMMHFHIYEKLLKYFQ